MKAKQSAVPEVANQKNLSAHNVNVLKIENPHQKMEGVQRVNKEEVIKMVDKAKQGGTSDGGFVKLQNYEFHVDVVEDDDAPKKIIKKDKKDGKKDAKKASKAPSKAQEPSSAQKDPEEGAEEEAGDGEEEPSQPQPPVKPAPKAATKASKQAEPKWVDVDPPPKQEEADDEPLEDDDELLGSDAEVAPPEPEPKSLTQSHASQTSQKKYRSGMASLMDEMIAESTVATDDRKPKQQKEDDVYDIENFEEQQKKYLKTIKQYQVRIKKLNQRLEQVPQTLPVINEEPEEQRLEAEFKAIGNNHVNDDSFEGQLNQVNNYQNIYEEFYKNAAIEDQLKNLVQQDKQEKEEQQRLFQAQQQHIEQMKLEHQREMAKTVQYYQSQMKNMQQKVKRYESYAAQQIHSAKKSQIHQQAPDGLSLISSNISNVIQENEIQQFYNDPDFEEIDADQLSVTISQHPHQLPFDESSILDLPGQEVSISDLGQSEVSSVSSGIDSVITERERKQFQSQIAKHYDKLNYEPALKRQLKNDSSIGQLVSDISVHSGVSSNIDAIVHKHTSGQRKFQDIDSDITDLIGDDSELAFDYAKTKAQMPPKHTKPPSTAKYEIDSDIGDLIDRHEQEELMQDEQFVELDSQLSISQVVDLGGVAKLVKAAKPKNPKYNDIDSDIGSLISAGERQQFDQQSMDVSLECSNSDIDSIISENEKRWMQEQEMYWRTDSNLDDEAPQFDPDSSFYRRLADELERDYRIPKQDKLEIYRRIIAKAKQEYTDQLRLAKPSKKAPSLASKQSKSDFNSSIGSLISQKEQAELLNNSNYSRMGSSLTSKKSAKSTKKGAVSKQLPKGCSDMNSSIGSLMSRGSQDLLAHDSQYSKMDSKISRQSGVSRASQASRISNMTSGSKRNVADFLNFKKGIINDLSSIAKGKSQSKDLTFAQKYEKFVAVKTREEQLRDIDSSISGIVSHIDMDTLQNMDSSVSEF